jgi:hypothetical protein
MLHDPRAVWVGIVLLAGVAPCRGNLVGSDNFDDNFKDPTKWGADSVLGSGVLTETNGRLEYSVASSDGVDQSSRPWILNQGSYDANWSVQVDLGLSEFALSGFEFLTMGMSIINADDSLDRLIVSLAQTSGSRHYFVRATEDSPVGVDTVVATTSLLAALRVTFNAADKTLTVEYDDDAGAGGYNWTPIVVVDVDSVGLDWSMSSGSAFNVALFGNSMDVVVPSGSAFADNFRVIPEPVSLAMLAPLTLLAVRRRQRPRYTLA